MGRSIISAVSPSGKSLPLPRKRQKNRDSQISCEQQTVMFLDSWIDYLDIHNASRITGLSIYDPFAMFGFVLLLLTIIIAMILLCITTRSSVESIFDGFRHDQHMRALRRNGRRATTVGDVMREHERQSATQRRATMGVPHRASFLIPASKSPPPPGRIALSERMPFWPSRKNRKAKKAGYGLIGPSPQSSWPLAPIFGRTTVPEPEHVPSRRSSLQTTPPVYEAYRQPAPQLHVALSREAMSRRWSTDFREELASAGGEDGLTIFSSVDEEKQERLLCS
ncbi:hypothetical protein LTR86_005207 [Recurvomyces mirabilis]|nr:hypothetical protein LTR86_005207 [Recurvomyces mirabilis]